MQGIDLWVLIAMLTLATVVIKGAGPFLLGDRDIPARLRPAEVLLPTALMTALITVALIRVGADGAIRIDSAQCVGVLAATMALLLRAPLVLSLALAVVATATVRALI